MNESTCDECGAPIFWPDATFYIDEYGQWRNKSRPLNTSGFLHVCHAVRKAHRPD